MSKKSISIVTLGCPKNQVDSEKLAAALSSAFIVEHEKEVADYKSSMIYNFLMQKPL